MQLLISANKQNTVTEFKVGSLQMYSDHCPLELVLACNMACEMENFRNLSAEPASTILFPLKHHKRWNKMTLNNILEQSDTVRDVLSLNLLLSRVH